MGESSSFSPFRSSAWPQTLTSGSILQLSAFAEATVLHLAGSAADVLHIAHRGKAVI